MLFHLLLLLPHTHTHFQLQKAELPDIKSDAIFIWFWLWSIFTPDLVVTRTSSIFEPEEVGKLNKITGIDIGWGWQWWWCHCQLVVSSGGGGCGAIAFSHSHFPSLDLSCMDRHKEKNFQTLHFYTSSVGVTFNRNRGQKQRFFPPLCTKCLFRPRATFKATHFSVSGCTKSFNRSPLLHLKRVQDMKHTKYHTKRFEMKNLSCHFFNYRFKSNCKKGEREKLDKIHKGTQGGLYTVLNFYTTTVELTQNMQLSVCVCTCTMYVKLEQPFMIIFRACVQDRAK